MNNTDMASEAELLSGVVGTLVLLTGSRWIGVDMWDRDSPEPDPSKS